MLDDFETRTIEETPHRLSHGRRTFMTSMRIKRRQAGYATAVILVALTIIAAIIAMFIVINNQGDRLVELGRNNDALRQQILDLDLTPAGPSSEDILQGEPGAQGPPGQDGRDGIDGADGEQGLMGVPGAVGPVGPPGETIVGPQGEQGEPGPQGEQGIQGIQGVQGVPGETGPNCPAGSTLTQVLIYTQSEEVDIPALTPVHACVVG